MIKKLTKIFWVGTEIVLDSNQVKSSLEIFYQVRLDATTLRRKLSKNSISFQFKSFFYLGQF